MNFTISNTITDELPYILKMNQEALPAVSSVSIEDMKHFLNIVDYFRTLTVENKIAGFLIALSPGKDYSSLNYKWFEKTYNSFMYVDRIVIDTNYHRNGLGTSFYNDLETFSIGKSSRITCEVNIRPKNEGSMAFHETYGFEQVGTQTTEEGKKEVSLMSYKLINIF
tara:strand:+ start:1856 stop:2356 length:501 start_codon:yes stop_codon:yes gene_type:complete